MKKNDKKLDSFLKNLGSMVYAKASELQMIADEVSKRYSEAVSSKPDIKSDKESSFQKVLAATLGCISSTTPPKTREALAFWTLISNQELDRWEVVELMNRNEIVIDGDEIDNEKLSKYLHEFKNDLEICMAVRYYDELNKVMPNQKAKKILYLVLKENGHFDIIIEMASLAIQLNRFQSAVSLFNLAYLINPQNSQAKQKLLEIYPKAIQDVIDDGRYEDAQKIVKTAFEMDRTNKTIAILRVKIIGYKFLSKFYPGEELYYESSWNALKDMGEIRIKPGMLPAFGFSIIGKNDISKKASLFMAISTLKAAKDVTITDQARSTEEIYENILNNLRKQKAPKKLRDKFSDFIND